MKKQFIFSILLLIILIGTAKAEDLPRYKGHFYLKDLVVGKDTLYKHAHQEFEMSFYEESDMLVISKGISGDVGIKMMGRPVMNNGEFTHKFDVIIFLKDAKADTWSKMNTIHLSKWEYPISALDLSRHGHSTETWNSGKFLSIQFHACVELIGNNYNVDTAAKLNTYFTINIDNVKINEKKVKLRKHKFEFLGSPNVELVIGSYAKQPVKLLMEVNVGTASNSKEYIITLYYYYFNTRTSSFVKRQFTEYIVKDDKSNKTACSVYGNETNDSLYLEYKLGKRKR